jgi:hypothetical protein
MSPSPKSNAREKPTLEEFSGHDHGLTGFLCRRSTLSRMDTGPAEMLLGGRLNRHG